MLMCAWLARLLIVLLLVTIQTCAANDNWIAQGKMFGPTTDANGEGVLCQIGEKVSMYGDRFISGCANEWLFRKTPNQINLAGAAYIGKLTDGQWIREQRLLAPNPSPQMYFGSSVSMYENRVAIAGVDAIIYIFEMQNNGSWSFASKLIPSRSGLKMVVGSKEGLCLWKDRVVFSTIGGNNQGYVYVFVYNDSSGSWEEEVELGPFQAGSVGMYGNKMAVAISSLYVAIYGFDGNEWILEDQPNFTFNSIGSGRKQCWKACHVRNDNCRGRAQ